ncbi:hypothetical protein JCM8547_004467 [Rhodosporidiobolus lusitaniae]
MQASQQYPQLKRRDRSSSPGPATKRRPPSTYTPSLFDHLPPASARAFSLEAATPTSERSSPGLDWLRQTQELQLETPPLGMVASGASWGGAGGAGTPVDNQDHAMMAEDHPSSFPPAPPPSATSSTFPPHPAPAPAAPFHSHSSSASHAALFSSASFAFADPTFIPAVPSPCPRAAPHDAPPLHQHLAGSPGPAVMTPSSSTGSLHSMHHLHHYQQQVQPSAVAMADVAMAGPGGQGGGGGKGGWKLTMGYRPDCEKCVGRVPGHYSHVVPQ